MKKKIALLISALLALVCIFAACSQAAATNKVARWDAGETYTFNVTLASYDTEQSIDEISPLAVKGTFTMTISTNNANSKKLETKQVVYSQYDTQSLKNLNCLDKLSARVATAAENPFDDNAERTTLRSETTTTVVFSDADQSPVSSVKENKGYYIGKEHQNLSEYKVEATYDFDKHVVTVKQNNGDAEEKKLGTNGVCIDSAQLLLYIRSLDKSSEAFQDSPSVYVYDPITATLCTAKFALTREYNAILNNNGEEVGTKIHAVSVTVDSKLFMTEYNLPDLTKAGQDEQGLDFRPTGADGKTCKYTTVRFRSGWYSYELSEYDQQIIEAIKVG